MKKILYILFSFSLLNMVSGCKKPEVTDVSTRPYYVTCNVNGDNLSIYSKDNNVYSESHSGHHYFYADKGTIHLSFGFLDSLAVKPFYKGGTYTLNRMDYGSGSGYGEYDDVRSGDNWPEKFQTHYAVDTGVLTISYNVATKMATGSFSFYATQTNPKPGESAGAVTVTDGTFSMMWEPN